MRKLFWSLLAVAMVATLAPTGVTAQDAEVIDLLVFTETGGFRHSSIPTGVRMMEDLVENEELDSVDFTMFVTNDSEGEGPLPVRDSGLPTFFLPDPVTWLNDFLAPHNPDREAVFTPENLANFDVVVWISTTGDVLDDEEQAAFEAFIRNGGGYVGIHAAGDSDRDWDWYEDLSGGQFNSHPATQQATIDVEVAEHASTAHLPTRWTRTDEWYNYQFNPRAYPCYTDTSEECGVRVLMTMDEDSYDNNADMGDHPIAWCNEWDGGRAWYTGLGHTEGSYGEQEFIDHVLGGILTAAGADELTATTDYADTGLDAEALFSCEPAEEDEAPSAS